MMTTIGVISVYRGDKTRVETGEGVRKIKISKRWGTKRICHDSRSRNNSKQGKEKETTVKKGRGKKNEEVRRTIKDKEELEDEDNQ